MKKIFLLGIFLLFASVAFAQTRDCNSQPVINCLADEQCESLCGSEWFCPVEKPANCTYTEQQEYNVPELTTIGIGAAIIAGGAAFVALRKKKNA
jgi:LPXTG-motif cell wall-anchored protein